jgi:hypothetical protein
MYHVARSLSPLCSACLPLVYIVHVRDSFSFWAHDNENDDDDDGDDDDEEKNMCIDYFQLHAE